MEIHPLSRKISPATLPLDRLAGNSHLSEAEKIAGISHHFEAVLLRQFLSEAQKPMLKPKGGLLGASHEIYQDMIVSNLAEAISKTGTFGLANAFQSQMSAPQKTNGAPGGEDAPSK